MTLLLNVFLMFRTTFLLDDDLCSKEEMGMLMFLPENWKKIVLARSYSNFFLEEAVHSMKEVLLFITQVMSLPMSFFIMVVMTLSGSPMYEALRVRTAVNSSGVSS